MSETPKQSDYNPDKDDMYIPTADGGWLAIGEDGEMTTYNADGVAITNFDANGFEQNSDDVPISSRPATT